MEKEKSGNATETVSVNSETDIWAGSPSQITNAKTFVLCGLVCWLVIPILIAAWRWLAVKSLRYELTTQRFRRLSGVLLKHTEELELYRIKDTSLSQTMFQRIFRLGTITMTSSDVSTPSMQIESIPIDTAKNLREKIRSIVEQLRDRKRVREVDFT